MSRKKTNNICPKCGVNQRVKGQAYCKECRNKYTLEWIKAHPDRWKELMKRAHSIPKNGIKPDTIAKRKHRHKWPERSKARVIITYLLQHKGLKPEPCKLCGSTENIQAHHSNYSEPYKIIWLCLKCHKDLHAKRIKLSNQLKNKIISDLSKNCC